MYILAVLVNLFIFIQLAKSIEDIDVIDFNSGDWRFVIICGLFPPFGYIMLILFFIGWVLIDVMEVDEWVIWDIMLRNRKLFWWK
jgi:hypothetical protein